jgi:hypothetical protein
LHQRVSHVAHAVTTAGKFITTDHKNVMILAVLDSMMDVVHTAYFRSLTGSALLARLMDSGHGTQLCPNRRHDVAM